MKQLSTLILLLISLVSCNNMKTNNRQSNLSESNTVQNSFIALVSTHADSIYETTKISNPIKQESEYTKAFTNFHESIDSFISTNILFRNFIGRIRNIKYEKGDESSFIYFDLSIEYDDKASIHSINHTRNKFNCIYTLKNIYRENDSLFINLQNINDNDMVYFNGFLSRGLDGNVSIAPQASVDGHMTGFYFSILDIDKKKLHTNYSSNLNNAIKAKFKELYILGQCMLANEDESVVRRKTSYLNLDSIINTLNNEEKQYINKIQKTYTLNLAREYINKR